MRKTKIICTIGPKTWSKEALTKLAQEGMNVARLNMSHGDHQQHARTIKNIKEVNRLLGVNIGIMLDSKGPEIRSGDLKHPLELQAGENITLTVERKAEYPDRVVEVNYDEFIHDIEIGDIILVDSGLITFQVKKIKDYNITCAVLEGGTLTSRRHLNIRGKSAQIPPITNKDWLDIDFAIEQNVDFFALSFVNGGSVVRKLKKYLTEKESSIKVVAKIESTDAVDNLRDIVTETDLVMIARGDLGAEIPLEAVPMVQGDIIKLCRKKGKPVIVATQMLESMMIHPTPTRAEVSDIYYAIKQRTDAIMMSGETASGNYPFKALEVMSKVALYSEKNFKTHSEKDIITQRSDIPKHEIALGSCVIANNINADAIIVFSQTGATAGLVSQCRPVPPVYAFTGSEKTRRHLSLNWGIEAHYLPFNEKNPEKTIQESINVLLQVGKLKAGNKVVIVSNIQGGTDNVHAVQYREIKHTL